MRRNWMRIRRALGAPLSALTLSVGAAGAWLDAADLVAATHMESSRDSEPVASGHDHRLCVQIGANSALPSHDIPRPVAWTDRAADPGARAPRRLPSTERPAPTARAPPQR